MVLRPDLVFFGCLLLVGVSCVTPERSEPAASLPSPAPALRCFTGDAVFESEERGYLIFGETALCGTDLQWRAGFGPDCQTHVEDLKQRIRGLEKELELWRGPL